MRKIIRRLFVLGSVLGCLLLAPFVEAQDVPKKVLDAVTTKMILGISGTLPTHGHEMVSGGCAGYSFGQTPYTWLTPSEEGKLGNAAVTLTFSATDGTKTSHHFTVGVNTTLTINWVGLNAGPITGGSNSALILTYALDNGAQGGPWYIPATASGSENYTFSSQWGWAGHTGHFRLSEVGKSGDSTQDIASVTVTNQAPGIYDYDNIPSNMYLRVNPNFGGGDMMHTCNICIQQPSACTGAQHTPYISGSLANNASGEVKTYQRQQAGSVVDENSPISGSAFWDISAMPSDVGDISVGATGEIFCSAVADDIYDSFVSFRIEYAKVVAKDLGHPGRQSPPPPNGDGSTIYDVAVLCDNNSDPPDWQPTVVHSYAGRHTYWWGVTSLFRAPDTQGTPWIPLASFLTGWNTSIEGPLDLAKMVIIGGAVPYPGGTGPDFPIPGACTQYPKNVILTLGSGDIPWWPFNN